MPAASRSRGRYVVEGILFRIEIRILPLRLREWRTDGIFELVFFGSAQLLSDARFHVDNAMQGPIHFERGGAYDQAARLWDMESSFTLLEKNTN